MADEGRARVKDCQGQGQKPIGPVNAQDVKFSIDDLENMRFVIDAEHAHIRTSPWDGVVCAQAGFSNLSETTRRGI